MKLEESIYYMSIVNVFVVDLIDGFLLMNKTEEEKSLILNEPWRTKRLPYNKAHMKAIVS
jgi:hypothetical protein